MLVILWVMIDIIFGILSVITWIGFEGEDYVKYLTSSIFLFITLILLLYFRKNIIPILKTKTFKNYLRETTTIFLTTIILLLLSYLGARYNFQKDITKIKIHTLTDQTKTILKNLKSKALVSLFANSKNYRAFDELLLKYQKENPLFEYKILDPNRDHAEALKFNITEEGMGAIQYEGATLTGLATSELHLTNLLIKIQRKEDFTLCFSTNHKEQSFDNELSYLKTVIVGNLYKLKEVSLLSGELPSECSLFMSLGPKIDFSNEELKNLTLYKKGGGNIFITTAPVFKDGIFKNLYAFIASSGIVIKNSVVIDRLSSLNQSTPTSPVIAHFDETHPATLNFKEKLIFPLSLSLLPKGDSVIRFTGLAMTSPFPASFAETNFEEIKKGASTFDKKDIEGPINVVASAYDNENQSRLVVIGSNTAFTNSLQGHSPNFNFYLNIVSWLIDDSGMIALNRPKLTQEKLFVSEGELNIILFFNLLFLPLCYFALSFHFYRRRIKG